MFDQPTLWLSAMLGYFLGAIPFGIILTRMTGAGDLRSIGSGNIGATNVLRTGRKGLAAATLLLDMLKGTMAVLLARMIWPEADINITLAAGAGAFIGHCYPVWLKFDGGKGVATLLGVCLGLDWPLGLIFALVWLGTLAISRYSSLSGIMAALITPLAAYLLGLTNVALLLIACAVLLMWKHMPNIQRLIAGEEPKVGAVKK
ncbi:glycerol-3-phosphate 1-O-acyltransferase PlsY [Parasphingorhabdus sp. DH2-15]|uniref:glycerol-3-phosphate 1-O-acyltransferase PlsY n=1 Tax=Parasphingorhabdus sp. DH2-15 TaxID=3444112 RepID=UPI003F685615